MGTFQVRAPRRSVLLAAIGLATASSLAGAQAPVMACDAAGIGAVKLAADGVQPTIDSVSTGKAGDVDYCLVKVLDYYERVVDRIGNLKRIQEFARLFMAPGVGRCAGGPGHQPQGAFEAVVNWVEKGIAPDTLPVSRTVKGIMQTRPLCPYPAVARWDGKGSIDAAASFSCAAPGN